MTGSTAGDVLSRDHAEVDVLLTHALDELREGGSEAAFAALDLFWARLAMHIRAEHLHLFPAALKSSDATSDIPEILVRLRDDHDFFMHELAAAIKSMRAITRDSEKQVMRNTLLTLETIRDRLAAHNVIEEERIYPLRKLLSSSEAEALSLSLARELENLPPRFAKRT